MAGVGNDKKEKFKGAKEIKLCLTLRGTLQISPKTNHADDVIIAEADVGASLSQETMTMVEVLCK